VTLKVLFGLDRRKCVGRVEAKKKRKREKMLKSLFTRKNEALIF
jgi:hypothetical protein